MCIDFLLASSSDHLVTATNGHVTLRLTRAGGSSKTMVNSIIVTPVSISASLAPKDPKVHAVALRTTEQATHTPHLHQAVNQERDRVPAPVINRQGGGIYSLRFVVPQLAHTPTNPLLHLVSHGGTPSTTMTPNPGSVLPGSIVTFFWSYSARSSSGTGNVPYRYTGKEQDDSTGLYYYEARYYDPFLSRFISADTIVPNPGNPQHLNRYAHANNNPILYTGPSGHLGIKSIKKGFKKVSRTLQNKLGETGFMALSFGIQVGLAPVPFLSSLQSGILGTALLTQSKSGRYVLAGEIIVGTAVTTWQCGGCGAAPVLKGALIGAVAAGTSGGISAAQNGGDISQGVLFGTVVGATTGAISGAFSPGANLSTFDKAILAAFRNTSCGFGSGLAKGFAGGNGNLTSILQGGIGEGVTSGFFAFGQEFFNQEILAPALDEFSAEFGKLKTVASVRAVGKNTIYRSVNLQGSLLTDIGKLAGQGAQAIQNPTHTLGRFEAFWELGLKPGSQIGNALLK